nr:DUF2599 domain-containing protein [Gordonia humi]
MLLGACGSDDAVSGPPSTDTSSPVSSNTDSSNTPESSTYMSTSQPPTSQPPTLPPPYIAGADWVDTQVGPSLQIRPTRNGRDVSGDGTADEAWSEVLAMESDADSPGMRAQFDCHWTFARLVDPDKPSWNLEPDRPVVSEQEMIAARCNPGFAEE